MWEWKWWACLKIKTKKKKNSENKAHVYEREVKETFMSCPSLVPMNSTIQDPFLSAATADIELYLNTTESGWSSLPLWNTNNIIQLYMTVVNSTTMFIMQHQ